MATACSPSTAITTSYPLRSRRRESMSRFISLSSTSKIFAIKSPSRHRLTIISRYRRGPDAGQLLGGDNHHRNMPPSSVTVERIEELETIHLRHHQVEQDQCRWRIFREPGQRQPSIGHLCHC